MDTSMNYESGGYNKKPVWFWLLIYLLVGGAVYAGYYYYAGYQNPDSLMYASPTPAVSPAASTNAAPVGSPAMIDQNKGTEFKITVTATTYTPSTLTIAVGDTVTWTNTLDKPSNVSSNPHPQHTNYAPLNLGMLKSGESKSLTFDQAGTYGYHNHLNATQIGTIIVK